MIELLNKHPAFLLLLSSFVLRYFKSRNEQLFKFCAILLPILTLIKFCKFETIGVLDVAGFKLIPLAYNKYNIIFGITLIVAHISASIYAIGNKQFNEIIWANIYGAASLFALLAKDFISLFCALEIMMIASSSIIFLGDHCNSKSSSMRYFIMHLTAGICILSGIILLTDSSMVREIRTLTLEGDLYSKTNIGNLLILLGFLINVGAPPFSAWMTDAYPQAKTSGTVFLSLYTTKIAAYYLLILFPGWRWLISIGLIMSLYGCIYAILENNIRRIICYLSIYQLGIVLMGIGLGTRESIFAAGLLIFSHIIYNSLFMILVGSFIDIHKIEKATEIYDIKTNIKPYIIGGFIGLLSLIAFPYSGPFFAKTLLGEHLYKYSNLIYCIYLALSCLIIIALPWRQLLSANYTEKKILSKTTKFAIYIISIICLLTGVITLIIFNFEQSLELHFPVNLIANQILMNFAAIGLIFLLYKKNNKTKHLLLSFDYFYRTIPSIQALEVKLSDQVEVKSYITNMIDISTLKLRTIFKKLMLLSHTSIIITLSLSLIIMFIVRPYA
jgi:multicomponent Na+:H+ antiporter subunit D